jgi:hypothetical protein
MQSRTIASIAALASTAWPTIASPQQAAGSGGSYVPPASLTYGTSLTPTQQAAQTAAQGAVPANPQAAQGRGGLQLDLGFNTSFKIDDNLPLNPTSKGTSYVWDTNLNFNLSSITPTDTLTFTGSGVVRFADFPGRSPAGFEDPTLRFSYSTDRKDSRFTVDARYRHTDREFLNPFKVEQEDLNSGGLSSDGGTVTTRSAGLRFETGLNDPFGTVWTLRHDDRRYANVTNPLLFDNQTDTAGLQARFDLSPVTTVTASAQMKWYTAEDAAQTDRQTLDLNVGLNQEINPALVVNVSAGYTNIDTTKFGVDTNRSGANGRIAFTQTMPNGDVTGSIDLVQTVNGSRTTLQVGRTLQFPNGTLSGSVGLTRGQSGSSKLVGRLAYNRQLKSQNFSVSVSRGASTNTIDQDVIDTRLALGYGYEINALSRIDLSLNYGLTERDSGSTASRVERSTFSATYSYALTSDWNLQSGIVIRDLDDTSSSGPAHSNSVFVSLGRNFSFRP